MSTVAGLPPGALEFALPHAVNLAEAGSSIEERKAGTFCVASLLFASSPARVSILFRNHASAP
jgi:hypothetical protein